MAHPEYGLEIVGFLDGDADEPLPAPMLGSPAEIARVVDEHEIDRVLLASSVGSHEETLDLVRSVRRPDVQVSIVPRYFEIFTSPRDARRRRGHACRDAAADAARAQLARS